MRLRSMFAAGVLGLAIAVPAHAGERPDPFAQVESLFDPGVLFQGVIRDEDVALVFAHLRAALLAAYAGREAPPPEELNRRAEALAGELKARGTLAGLLLLTAIEAAARQAVREGLEIPAPAAR
jgi:hypothetical protein